MGRLRFFPRRLEYAIKGTGENNKGKTLYTFHNDQKGLKRACAGGLSECSRVRARACACFASSGISRMSSARYAPGSSREGRGMRREGGPPKRWRPGLGCWGRYD